MKKEKFLDRMTDKLASVITPIAEKMSRSNILSSIGDAMMATLPIVLIGSFALLIAALDVGPWQNIVNSIPYLVTICYKINTVTTGMFAIYAVGFLGYIYSGKINLKERVVATAISVAVFLLITPFDESGALPSTWIGTSGLITAMIIGIVVPSSIKFMLSHNMKISMPKGVPTFVEDSFSVLVPSIIIFSVASVLNTLVSLTSYGDIQNMIFTLIQTPLSAIGLSLPGFLFISTLTGIVFWCGIHGNSVIGAMLPLLMAADAANLAAGTAGEALPNVITYQFLIATIPGGYCQLLIPAFLAVVFCKSKQLKSIGKASLVPAIFCIGEPVLFGFPVMFNPLLFIPVVLGNVFNVLFWYGIIKLGIIGAFSGVILPWTTPPVLLAFLSSSTPIPAAIASVVMLIGDCFIWYPFMKIFDKQNVESEMELEG